MNFNDDELQSTVSTMTGLSTVPLVVDLRTPVAAAEGVSGNFSRSGVQAAASLFDDEDIDNEEHKEDDEDEEDNYENGDFHSVMDVDLNFTEPASPSISSKIECISVVDLTLSPLPMIVPVITAGPQVNATATEGGVDAPALLAVHARWTAPVLEAASVQAPPTAMPQVAPIGRGYAAGPVGAGDEVFVSGLVCAHALAGPPVRAKQRARFPGRYYINCPTCGNIIYV